MGCFNSKTKMQEQRDKAVAEWPEGVEKDSVDWRYENWDESTLCSGLVHAIPKNADDIVKICEWAVKFNVTVRASGSRHNWCPMAVDNKRSGKDAADATTVVVVLDMKAHFDNVLSVTKSAEGEKAGGVCVVQPGIQLDNFMEALETWNKTEGDIGYSFVNTPGVTSITLGGMLAIAAHGNSVTPDEDNGQTSVGSLCNVVLGVKAIAWDAEAKKYTEQEFTRDAGNLAPFLTAMGRTILTEVTMEVIDNYYMRCVSTFTRTKNQLFAPPNEDGSLPADCFSALIGESGRLESIAFPFTKKPWLKQWFVTGSEKPESSRLVEKCDNYTFSDGFPELLSNLYSSLLKNHVSTDTYKRSLVDLMQGTPDYQPTDEEHDHDCGIWCRITDLGTDIKDVVIDGVAEVVALPVKFIVGAVGSPKYTEDLNYIARQSMVNGVKKSHTGDIWGTSKNTLMYVSSSTMRITANGYAVQVKRSNLQHVLHAFDTLFEELIQAHADKNEYPINMPTEIRCCGLNDAAKVGKGNGVNPPLDPLSPTAASIANGWDIVVYFNVITMPGTEGSTEFYHEFEQRLYTTPSDESVTDYSHWFTGDRACLMCEWSKGWAYDRADGAWESAQFRTHIKAQYPDFKATTAALAAHDPKNLFVNEWLTGFMEIPAPVADVEEKKDDKKGAAAADEKKEDAKEEEKKEDAKAESPKEEAKAETPKEEEKTE